MRKEKEEALQRNFLENLKQLVINIPFYQSPSANTKVLTCLANELSSKEKDPRSFTIPCQVLEKHKEAENLASDHLSRLKNPYMEVLTEWEIANKFPDEHLMVLKSKFNNDEPWYADFVNYIVGKVVPPNWTFEKRKRFFSQVKTYFWDEPYAFKLCADNIVRRCVAGSETLELLAHCHSRLTVGIIELMLPQRRSRNTSSRNEMPQNNIQRDMWGTILKIGQKNFNDALWEFRTAYRTPTGCTPLGLVHGKACHLPVKIKHKAHWALKQCEFTLSSLDVLQGFSFFLQTGLTLILATLNGVDVALLGNVIGEDDCDDDG
nr:hypothetical protein [Tanacetum cinerariifolium]